MGIAPRTSSTNPTHRRSRYLLLRRWLALALVSALTLSGGIVLGAVFSAGSARAVTYSSHWNGQLGTSQLWVVPAGTDATWTGTQPYLVTAPNSFTAANFAAQITAGFDWAGDAHGAACQGEFDSLATGPILARQGDTTPMAISWDSVSGQAAILASAGSDCYPVSGEATLAGAAGGEVNPVTGELYLVDGLTQFDGDASSDDPGIKVVQVRETAPPWSTEFKAFEWLTAPATAAAATGARLMDVAAAAGKTGDLGANWTLSSDITFSGSGAAYRLARLGQPNSNTGIFALVRFTTTLTDVTGDGRWTYDVVRVFDDLAVDNAVGLAFVDDTLYSAHADGALVRWDILGGIGQVVAQGSAIADLAATDPPAVLEGRLLQDTVGLGTSASQGGSGLSVEIWAEDSTTARRPLGTLLTAPGTGRYWTTLPVSASPYYVRVLPPQGTTPRVQTRASYQVVPNGADPATVNQVIARCALPTGDYMPVTSGVCGGARRDGLNPLMVFDPLDPTHGAGIVSEVRLVDRTKAAAADFWLTDRYAWGDSIHDYQYDSAGVKASASSLLLWLGAGRNQLTLEANATECTKADCQRSDDGLMVTRWRQDGDYSAAHWITPQAALLAAGGRYHFRLQVSGDFAPSSWGKAWLAPLVNGISASAMTYELMSGVPDADGYLYADYTIPADPVGDTPVPMFIRARATTDPDATATSRSYVGYSPTSGVVPGDIEDYAVGVADTVIAVKARMHGVSAAFYGYGAQISLGNVTGSVSGGLNPIAIWASMAAGAVTITPETYLVGSVTDPARPVTITTVGAGRSASSMDGWMVDPQGTNCRDQQTGNTVAVAWVDSALEVSPADGSTGQGSWSDLLCEVFYVQQDAVLEPTLTLTPTPDPAQPRPTGGTYTASVAVHTVDSSYTTNPDVPITLKLEAVGAAPADGAYFADTGTTQTECITTDSGRCNYVTIVGAAAGTYRLTAEPHDALGGLATAELYFADPVQEPEPPDEPRSGTWIEATDLESVKEADHGLSEGAVGYAAPWDFYTVHTQLLDAQGAPLGGLADQLEYEWYAKDYYCASWLYGYQGRGLVFGETTEVSGETGHYTVPVYSNQSCHAGIEVFLETDETWEEIYPQDEDLSTLEVTFVPLSRIDPDNSGMFRLTTSGYADWDEEAWNESPEGTNSVQYLLRLRDANGSDLVTDFTSDEPAFDFSDAVTLAAASPPTLHLSVADRVYVSRVNGEGVASAGILAYFGTTLAGELCPRVIVTLPGANPLELSCDAPVLIYAGDIDVNRSSVTVSQTLGQPANHDDQAASAETWGRQTITATVRDAQGNPANRYVYLTAQAAVGDPYNGSALYFDPEGFVCSVAEDDLGCPTGIYTLAVYSGRSGYRAITVGPDWRDAEKFRNGDYPAHTTLWAPFVGEVSPLASTLEVTPAEGPDAVPSQIALGQPYTVTVTAWDATQVNRIGAQLVELTLTGDNCTAAFPDGQASLTRFTSETGQVTTTVTASTISQCDLTARLAGTELSGSPKALQWDSLEPDPHAAGTYFFVGPDPLPANGVQTGTVTVQLESASGVPATGGARRLRIGQARSDLVLSGFEPTAAGTYTATVKGTLAQPVALTVYLDEAPLNVQDGASNVVNFVNAALSAQDSTFTIPTKADAKIVAQEFHEPRVTLRDVSGNLYVKESVQVTFQYRLVPASGYQPGAWQTGERVWSDTATGVASWPGFTRQTAGEYQVRAVLTNGSTPIPDTDSIITVRFVGDEAIAASPSRFGISGTDRLATGDDPYIAWVVLTDQYGNPAGPGVEVVFTVDANAVGGDAVTMSPPDGKTETCDFDAPAKPTWCTERGKAQVSITSTAPGSIDVSASLNSEIINGAPQTVSFVVDRIDLDRSSYTLTPGATVAAGSGNYTLTVTVVSAMGILVPEAAVRINGLSQYLTQTPAGEGTTGLPDQTTYGTYTWELTSTRAGLYIATVQVYTTTGWENLTRGSVRFSFVPGEPCPSCSTLSVPTATDPLTGAPTLTVEAGTNHTAEVLVRDAYGNVAYDQAARVVFSYQDISSPAGVIGSSDEVPTNGFGVAEWSFTSPVAATWQVSARLVGTTEDVAGSPTTASFHAPRDPTVYASWRLEPVNDAAVKADGQDAFRVTVAIRTGDGRGLPGEPVTLQLPSRVTANPEGPYTTDANGLVILTLQSTWAGNYQIRAATGEPPTDLDAATITFVMPQPVSGPGLTRLVAPGGAVSADATQTQTVLAYVTDSTGAPIKGAPVTFTLADGLTAPAAPGQSEVTLTTGEAGTAELAVTANRPDLFDITATAAGTPITEGSPVQLRFTNAPLQAAASQLELVGGAWVVSATDPGGVVRARLFDELGNPFTDAAQVTFAYRAAGDTTWTQGATVEAARGIAEWDSFAQTTAGRYEVQASVADQLIGSPVSVTFSPGPVDEAASLATLTLASAPAAPGASIGLPVTIWLQDAYGNAVPDATVVFELVYDEPTGATFTTGAKTWSGPANQDGMATASVISDVEGSFAVRARVGSSWSSEPYGVVQFVADTDTADPARSEFTAAPSPTNQLITGALADGADSYTVTILVRGTRGGELADVGGLVQVEPLFAGPTTRSLPFTTGADGRATVTVATTLAGSYRIGVRLGEAPLATTAGGTIYGIDAQFTPGPPTAGAALSRLVAPSEAAPADGQTAQTVTAYLFDAFGNAIAGAPVVFAVPDGLTAGLTAGQTPGPATVAVYTNAAGVAELAFTASAQDTYEVTATSGSFVFLEVAAIRFEDNVAPQPPSVNPTNGQRLAGAVHADDLPDAARGTLIAVVVTPGTGEVVTRALVAPDGTFEAPLGDLAHATDLHVHIQDAAGNRSGATPVTVDGAAPATSVLVPFDGSAIQGSGAEVGATVSVRDEQGYALCTPAVVVGSDGTWQCQLTPPAAPGETITVVTTDTAGNATTQTWRVGLPQLVFLAASVAAGSPAHLTGANFQPGEQIVGTMYSDPVDLGSVAADGSGALVFDWTVPADAAVGEHTVELVGALSGKVTATFTVTPAGGPPKPTPTASSTPSVPNTPSPTSRDRAESLPLTGPNVAAPLATAILAISLGAGMAASRRRRSAEAAERGR